MSSGVIAVSVYAWGRQAEQTYIYQLMAARRASANCAGGNDRLATLVGHIDTSNCTTTLRKCSNYPLVQKLFLKYASLTAVTFNPNNSNRWLIFQSHSNISLSTVTAWFPFPYSFLKLSHTSFKKSNSIWIFLKAHIQLVNFQKYLLSCDRYICGKYEKQRRKVVNILRLADF